MANCTDAACGHAASLHRNSQNGRLGSIGSGCPACAGNSGARCKGLALASANCSACGDPVAAHMGFGLACHGACVNTGTRCPGGTW